MARTHLWKRLAATAGVALALLAGCSSPAAAPSSTDVSGAAGSGGLVAKAAAVDLGQVPFDKLVQAQFELTNTSGKPIKLTAQPQVKMLEGC